MCDDNHTVGWVRDYVDSPLIGEAIEDGLSSVVEMMHGIYVGEKRGILLEDLDYVSAVQERRNGVETMAFIRYNDSSLDYALSLPAEVKTRLRDLSERGAKQGLRIAAFKGLPEEVDDGSGQVYSMTNGIMETCSNDPEISRSLTKRQMVNLALYLSALCDVKLSQAHRSTIAD